MKQPPKGIYLVAVVFLCAGLLCIAALLTPVYYFFGFERRVGLLQQTGYAWVLVGDVLAFWLICYGVVALVRLRPAPQWVFFAMTLFLIFQFFSVPVVNSPFYSPRRIYLNRFLLLLPLLGGCVYLLLPRFRTACREFRATIHKAGE